MASRAILRKRKTVSDYLNVAVRSAQTLQSLGQGQSSHCFDSRSYTSFTDHTSQNSVQLRENDETSAFSKTSLDFSTFGIFGHRPCGTAAFRYGNRTSDFSCLMGVRLMSQYRYFGSTATVRQPDMGSDDEDNENMTAKRKKEASPEECDQAVAGLSTAKAKAKAKQLQESQNKPILKKLWATFLGIGPALRAVASMSRSHSSSTYTFCSLIC